MIGILSFQLSNHVRTNEIIPGPDIQYNIEVAYTKSKYESRYEIKGREEKLENEKINLRKKFSFWKFIKIFGKPRVVEHV